MSTVCEVRLVDADAIAREVQRVAGDAETAANEALARDAFAESKRILAAAQRELRVLKKDAADAERAIREAAAEQRLKISGSGQTIGMFMGSKARGAMARGRAAEKRSLAAKQAKALQPFANVKSMIDRTIMNMDAAKAQITEAAASATRETESSSRTSQKRQSVEPQTSAPPSPYAAAPPPPPPPPPPMWTADPTGRHQYRFWDGQSWTEHVSNDGVAAVDTMPE